MEGFSTKHLRGHFDPERHLNPLPSATDEAALCCDHVPAGTLDYVAEPDCLGGYMCWNGPTQHYTCPMVGGLQMLFGTPVRIPFINSLKATTPSPQGLYRTRRKISIYFPAISPTQSIRKLRMSLQSMGVAARLYS